MVIFCQMKRIFAGRSSATVKKSAKNGEKWAFLSQTACHLPSYFSFICQHTVNMTKIYCLFVALLLATTAQAQSEARVATTEKLKVVFHLTSNDTLVHKALAKQLANFLVAAPKAKIEVVCHNNGIAFLQISATKQAEKIRELKAMGVDFVACENTMRERKIKREELVGECRTVPSGVVEVVLKQNKGWAYIKAGF